METLDIYNDLLYIHISEIFKNNSKKELYQYFYENTDKIVLIDNSDEPDFVFSNKDIIFWKEIDKLFPHNNCFLLTMGYDQNKFFEFKNMQVIYFDLAHLFITKQIFDDNKHESEVYLKPDMVFLKSLNHKPHPHRIKMVDELYRTGLLDANLVTWNVLTSEYKKSNPNISLPKFEYWTEEKIKREKLFTKKNAFINKSLFFDNANFVNLVGETISSTPVITEKTFGAIYNKEIFLSYGISGLNNKLEKLGFKLYHEIFDYKFDKYPFDNKTINDISNQLKRMNNKDYVSIKSQIKDKIMYNFKLANKLVNDCNSIPFQLRTIIDNFYNNLQKSKLGYTMRAVLNLYLKK